MIESTKDEGLALDINQSNMDKQRMVTAGM
jgi:hypothetical protein